MVYWEAGLHIAMIQHRQSQVKETVVVVNNLCTYYVMEEQQSLSLSLSTLKKKFYHHSSVRIASDLPVMCPDGVLPISAREEVGLKELLLRVEEEVLRATKQSLYTITIPADGSHLRYRELGRSCSELSLKLNFYYTIPHLTFLSMHLLFSATAKHNSSQVSRPVVPPLVK